MLEKVRIGFIGCGFMGQCVHLPSFRKVKNAEITAIADLRLNLAKAVAEKWKISKVYPSHIEMIEDKDVDAVVVITNKFTHAPIVIDALNAGKHVFVEKPMATTSEDAKRMAEVARKNSLKLMVGYMKRYDTGVLKAKEIFEEFVKTDKITYVRSHIFGGDWICGPPAEEMIKTEEEYQEIKPKFPDFLPKELIKVADNLLEQIHDINLPRYFIGEPIAVDFSKIWPDGFIAIIDYGEYPLLLEMSSISADFWEEQLIIYFKNGWIDLRPPPPLLRNVPAKVHVYRAGKIQCDEYPHGRWTWSFERQAQHFIECIIEDKEPVSSGDDSYKDIAITEAILKSAVDKKRTEVKI